MEGIENGRIAGSHEVESSNLSRSTNNPNSNKITSNV
jgi:hypothetical protein